jgi:hypothetical protein
MKRLLVKYGPWLTVLFLLWRQETLETAVEKFAVTTADTMETAIREFGERVSIAVGDARGEED